MDVLICHFQREDRVKVLEGMVKRYNFEMYSDVLSYGDVLPFEIPPSPTALYSTKEETSAIT